MPKEPTIKELRERELKLILENKELNKKLDKELEKKRLLQEKNQELGERIKKVLEMLSELNLKVGN